VENVRPQMSESERQALGMRSSVVGTTRKKRTGTTLGKIGEALSAESSKYEARRECKRESALVYALRCQWSRSGLRSRVRYHSWNHG
jgi:hypothetical protein